jgi:hypothetical protein
VATLAAGCDGAGSCPDAQRQDCGIFACGVDICLGDCALDEDCLAEQYCSAGVCVALLGPGTACAADSQCAVGTCVDGVCCNSACGGQCEACDVAGSLGTCTPVDGAPHGSRTECAADGPLCGGSCDGQARGACAYPGAGVECRAPACTEGVATVAAGCNGAGACPDLQLQACGAFVCGANVCLGDCTDDADCESGNFCSAGVCVPRIPTGTLCTGDDQCVSDRCIDGVCCETSCDGQCEACDRAGFLGICSPVSGDPRGGRAPCGGDGVCAGSCDGSEPDVCVFPESDIVCSVASCSVGLARAEAACNGNGACDRAQASSCGNYACDGEECRTSCARDGDCGTGFVCDAGNCVDDGGSGGSGGNSGNGGNGGDAGETGEAGDGVAGSAGGGEGGRAGAGGARAGSAGTGAGAAPLESTFEGGGCACRTAGGDRSSSALYLLAMLGAVGALGRRRATRRAPSPAPRRTTR